MPYLLGLFFLFSVLSAKGQGQAWASLPDEITFANVPIHLTAQTRQLVHQELKHLYASPDRPQQELDALRQMMPLWTPFFQAASLPDDYGLIALPFNDTDTLGYWALSTPQARQLALHMDNRVDERYHPLKATQAVVAMLQQWPQSSPVARLLRFLEWTTLFQHPQAIDHNYVQPDTQSPPILWRLLARKVALTAPTLRYRPTTSTINYVYPLRHEQSLREVTQRLPVTLEQLRASNRWLKSDRLPATGDYSLIVPLTPEGFAQAAQALEPVNPSLLASGSGWPVLSRMPPPSDPLRASAQYYRINQLRGVQAQNCDNLITLAFYGDMPVHRFLHYNDLPDEKAVIQPGQLYYLQAKKRRGPIPFHVLAPNQTLLEVANLYGIRLESLLHFNRLSVVHRLPAGRVLWLQRKRPTSQPVTYVKLPQPPAPISPPDSATTTGPVRPPNATPARRDSLLYSLGKGLLIDSPTSIESTTLEDTASSPLTKAHTEPDRPADQWHVVQPGQTYYSIAHLYHISLPQLYRWNQLAATIPLRIGQSLRVSNGGAGPSSAKLEIKKPVGARSGLSPVKTRSLVPRTALFHTVQTGQNLYRIALQYKVRVKDLVDWNDLKNSRLETGQILLIWR